MAAGARELASGRRSGCGRPASGIGVRPRFVVRTAPSASVRCSASSAPTTSTTRSPSRTTATFGLTGGSALARPRRGRALARPGRGRATSTSTAAPPARSCDASRSAGGSGRASARPPRPGGPNYVATLVRWHDTGVDIDAVAAAYQAWMRDIGHREHDPTGLAAERNVHRYRALRGGVLVRCASKRRLTAPASWWRPRRARPARAPYGRTPPASQRPFCAHGSERSASTGSDSLATALEAAVTTSALAAHAAGVSVDDAPTRRCAGDRATEVAARAVCDHDDASPRQTPARDDILMKIVEASGRSLRRSWTSHRHLGALSGRDGPARHALATSGPDASCWRTSPAVGDPDGSA